MKHISKIHIRFSDIDTFGHVNNATYLTYFEEARVKFFDEVVEWGYDWSKEGVILARAKIDFVQPVHFRDDITIYTACHRIGTKSFDLIYQMVKFIEEKEILLASATTVMVAYDYQEKKSISIPEKWKLTLASCLDTE